VDATLRRQGFELLGLTPQRWRRWSGRGLTALAPGQPVWADALYVKDLPHLGTLWSLKHGEELEHALATGVAVCLLYGAADYALELVDLVGSRVTPALAREFTAAVRDHDLRAAEAGVTYQVPVTGRQLRIMRKLRKRTGMEPSEQLSAALDAWLVAHAGPAPEPIGGTSAIARARRALSVLRRR
jgi:hypothetical protein